MAQGFLAIDRDLPQDGGKLLRREPVAQRAAEMRLEFVHSAEAGDHAEIEDAAAARLQSIVAPYRAPTIFGEQRLKFAVEVVGIGDRPIDLLVAHGHAAVVNYLIHGVRASLVTANSVGCIHVDRILPISSILPARA